MELGARFRILDRKDARGTGNLREFSNLYLIAKEL